MIGLSRNQVCQLTERERFPTCLDRFYLGAKQLPAIALCRKVGRPRRGVRRRYISLATCPQAMTPPDHNPAAASSSRAQNCGGGAKLPRPGCDPVVTPFSVSASKRSTHCPRPGALGRNPQSL